MLLPTLASATTCVAFCPNVFESDRPAAAAGRAPAEQSQPQAARPAPTSHGAADAAAFMQLGYKLVFAVGSTDSVFIYDTGVPVRLLPFAAQHRDVTSSECAVHTNNVV